ncbi:MAG: ETC complex I subunit, partial [Alphaproteobacteria bacterium]|nr:ETC complex I subunit [Alphaproteobacteria bacterium]
MPVRIYKPARNAMQSGKGKSQDWILEFEASAPRTTDPLMGWTSSGDTRQQVKLRFETCDLA